MVISGSQLAKEIKENVKERVKEAVMSYGRAPHLVVILVGEDPASQSYVKGKGKDAEEVGFKSTTIRKPDTITEEELLDLIKELNKDEEVDGILVQLPLPKHIDEDKVIETIDQSKDVDGFHPANVAALWQKRPCTYPCTPKGIIKLLDKAGVEIQGKKAVVIGRSNIVGSPISILLGRNAQPGNCTVTLTHSRTKDIEKEILEADIIVAAIGKKHFVKEHMVKEGAIVIDVGINRETSTQTKSGFKLYGDVDFENVAPKTSWITPVPGGVGLMTIIALLRNTLDAAKREVYP